MNLALLAAAALAAPLVVLALRTHLARRRAPSLPRAGAAMDEVVALLPVRDEEDNVGPCLDGLLAQTAAPRVLVIDDGSHDDTLRRAALRAHRAGGAPRLAVVSAPPLPAGWRGKLHALEVGLRAAAGLSGDAASWVLTTDADTRHHPELLARALAAAAERGLDCLSIAGFQQARGAGENLVTPPAFALLDAALGDWERAAASPVGPGARPVANGQYLLIRWRALEAIGGFGAVRDAAIDDVELAAALARHGFRCGFFRAPDLLRIRMYQGLRGSLHGWCRNLGALFGPRSKFTPATIALLVLPPAALLAAAAASFWLAAGVLWFAGVASSALFRRGSGHNPAWSLLYPLDALLLAALLAVALRDWRRGRLASWRGRPMAVISAPH